MPFGAQCRDNGGVRFRLWAPGAETIEVCILEPARDQPTEILPMSRGSGGWFELESAAAGAGTLYRYRVNQDLEVPDPASRFQPRDVRGPSLVVDPCGFDWQDQNWRGLSWEQAVVYELHVGTFTAEGSFRAVESRLDYLAELGITALELMPIADFPGRRNWGYDGVLPYAPDSAYGAPEDLKRLIQAAHGRGLMVFLDVVYNHFGPEGNYLRAYAPDFFSARHHTPWGDAINFDGPSNRPVRDFFLHNALYWLEEYHFDGLRLDAVHAIVDDSKPDILIELAETVRGRLGNGRYLHLVLENGNNDPRFLARGPEQEARWYDAQWNDDIHHALHVLISGETDGYYADYSQHPISQLGRCLSQGFAYQGEISPYRGNRPLGASSRHLPPGAFVSFLQNHDQIGNRAFGERIVALAGREAVRAAMAILLLAPSPPLLFMGEEFAAATPFLFFSDFEGELAASVREGRRDEFSGFERFSSPATRAKIPDPNSQETFRRSKLDWESLELGPHRDWLEFYRGLLRLRREHITRLGDRSAAEFTVHPPTGLRVEWQFARLTITLLANLGSVSQPAPPAARGRLIYASGEDVISWLDRKTLPPWSVAWFLNP
jgi:malto-oligosyltrehalose trehalohydrolase